jgi:hypothetical protein
VLPLENTVRAKILSASNSKNFASALPCSSGPHAAAGPSAIILWRTPAKLKGDLALPLLDTPFEVICAIFITFNEMSTVLHHIGFIATGGGEESCSAASAAAARRWRQRWRRWWRQLGGSAAAAAAGSVAAAQRRRQR